MHVQLGGLQHGTRARLSPWIWGLPMSPASVALCFATSATICEAICAKVMFSCRPAEGPRPGCAAAAAPVRFTNAMSVSFRANGAAPSGGFRKQLHPFSPAVTVGPRVTLTQRSFISAQHSARHAFTEEALKLKPEGVPTQTPGPPPPVPFFTPHPGDPAAPTHFPRGRGQRCVRVTL